MTALSSLLLHRPPSPSLSLLLLHRPSPTFPFSLSPSSSSPTFPHLLRRDFNEGEEAAAATPPESRQQAATAAPLLPPEIVAHRPSSSPSRLQGMRRNSSSHRFVAHERWWKLRSVVAIRRTDLLQIPTVFSPKIERIETREDSDNFVTMRTPTQVVSHAQKYFIRQLSGGKDKRRSSIHDITTVNLDQTKSSSPEKDGSNLPEKSSLILQQRALDGNVVVRNTYDDSELTNQGLIIWFALTNTTHLQGTSSSPTIGINLHQHFHR